MRQPETILGTVGFQLLLEDSSTRKPSHSSRYPSLYPNPVHDRFFINNSPDLGRLEVYNSLGVKVRVFQEPELGDSFDVADLPQGVYLLSLIGTDGKVIRTIRMVRRDFRP
ncbi:MAG: T9SS type A sorting domain-containing protein [Bacteroidota bacterium]